jgi:hypothetical protein
MNLLRGSYFLLVGWGKSREIGVNKVKKKYRNWVGLVWELSGHLGRLFLRYLEHPNSHIVQNQKNGTKPYSRSKGDPYFPIKATRLFWQFGSLWTRPSERWTHYGSATYLQRSRKRLARSATTIMGPPLRRSCPQRAKLPEQSRCLNGKIGIPFRARIGFCSIFLILHYMGVGML